MENKRKFNNINIRTLLSDCARNQNIPLYILEKDFAIEVILTAISLTEPLKQSLVFKGGTALKKIYFGNYRFSEDLDFTMLPQINLSEKEIIVHLKTMTSLATKLLQEYGPFEVNFKKKSEKNPHPQGQLAYVIWVKFPWHPTTACRIKLEVTFNEIILTPIQTKPLLYQYIPLSQQNILVYSLEEICAEKIRALLQSKIKLETKGWQRPRSRDFYDLWRIHNDFKNTLNLNILSGLIKPKCVYKNIPNFSRDELLSPLVINDAKKHWENNLIYFVDYLPKFEDVLTDVTQIINNLCFDKEIK